MPVVRRLKRASAIAAALTFVATASQARAQEPRVSVQKLVEQGALAEAVQRAEGERENPESTYLAAQALTKMNNAAGAVEQYSRLREQAGDDWRAIGESGALLLNGDTGGAMAAAERAVAVNGDNPYAHYQVGLVANRQNQFDRALSAFSRATEIKPDLAYAHYYAGTASQRLKQIARMSEHFELFLKLAPDAPERAAVAALLRTYRPRR